MRQAKSSPNLATPTSTTDMKFIFPPDRTMCPKDLQKALEASGMAKEKLEARDSLGGYWTPRATIKKETFFPTQEVEKPPLVVPVPVITKNVPPPSRFRVMHPGESNGRLKGVEEKFKARRITEMNSESPAAPSSSHSNSHHLPKRTSSSSLNDPHRQNFSVTQTPPMPPPPSHHPSFSPILHSFPKEHRGELDMAEKYNYDLSKAQLKASSRTSALLAGFAMVALVELQYDQDTPRPLLILLGVVTSLLVSVHLLALMMSTCILPYMEATGCTQDSPHLRLKFYIDLSWLFSTCIGLLLFLVEIGIIFFVKFDAVGYRTAGYITTAMIVPVVVIFIVFSYLIHKSRVSHSLGRFKHKVDTMKQFLDVEAQMGKPPMGTVKDI